MSAFNLTVEVNARLNSGSLRSVASQMSQGLKGGVNVPVNAAVPPGAATGLDGIRRSMAGMEAAARSMAASAQTASRAMASFVQATSRVASESTRATTATRSVGQAARAASEGLKAGGDAAEYFGHQMRNSVQRFVAFEASAGILRRLGGSFRESISEAVDFERAMLKVAQVASESPREVAALGTEVGRVSVALGVSSKDLVQVAEQLKQTGLSVKDVKTAIEPLGKASLAPSFGDMAKTTQGAIAATRQFGIEIGSLEETLGKVNAVSANFAVESNDIIEAVKRAGGAFRSAGGNLDEFMALFTAVRATTRQSAETIATGLRTIFTRLQRPETIENLRELGIQLQYTRREAEQMGDLGLENQFVGPYEAVRRLSKELSGVRSSDPRFAAVAEQVGGYRQISQTIPLIEQQKLAQDALNVSMAGGSSLTAAAEKAQGALFVQVQKVRQEIMELGRNLLNSPGLRVIVQDALKLASVFTSLLDTARPLLPVITGIAAVRIGQGFGSLISGLLRGPSAPVSSPQGGVPRFHTGGAVPGTGEQPAVLQGGEYVLSRKTVDRMGGKANLDRVNFFSGGGGVTDEAETPTWFSRVKRLGTMAGKAMFAPFVAAGAAAGATARAAGATPDEEKRLRGRLFAGDYVSSKAVAAGLTLAGQPALAAAAYYTPFASLGWLGWKATRDPRAAGKAVSEASGKALEFAEKQGLASRKSLERSGRDVSRMFAWLRGERNPEGYASGGEVVNARVMPGEWIFTPEQASRIGTAKLRRMNDHATFAAGGLVPGTGNTDSVPALLPVGSFVIKKKSVEKLGASNLAYLTPGYADGGPVGSRFGTPFGAVRFFGDGGDVVRSSYGRLIADRSAALTARGVSYEEIGRGLEKLFKDFGREIADSARVLVRLKDAAGGAGKVISEITLEGPVTGRKKVKVEEKDKDASEDFAAKPKLTDEQQVALYRRNLGKVTASLRKTPYGQSLDKSDLEHLAHEQTAMAAMRFDPTRMGVRKRLGRKLTADDVTSEDPEVLSAVDAGFMVNVMRAGKTGTGRAIKDRKEQGISLNAATPTDESGIDVSEEDNRRRIEEIRGSSVLRNDQRAALVARNLKVVGKEVAASPLGRKLGSDSESAIRNAVLAASETFDPTRKNKSPDEKFTVDDVDSTSPEVVNALDAEFRKEVLAELKGSISEKTKESTKKTKESTKKPKKSTKKTKEAAVAAGTVSPPDLGVAYPDELPDRMDVSTSEIARKREEAARQAAAIAEEVAATAAPQKTVKVGSPKDLLAARRAAKDGSVTAAPVVADKAATAPPLARTSTPTTVAAPDSVVAKEKSSEGPTRKTRERLSTDPRIDFDDLNAKEQETYLRDVREMMLGGKPSDSLPGMEGRIAAEAKQRMEGVESPEARRKAMFAIGKEIKEAKLSAETNPTGRGRIRDISVGPLTGDLADADYVVSYRSGSKDATPASPTVSPAITASKPIERTEKPVSASPNASLAITASKPIERTEKPASDESSPVESFPEKPQPPAKIGSMKDVLAARRAAKGTAGVGTASAVTDKASTAPPPAKTSMPQQTTPTTAAPPPLRYVPVAESLQVFKGKSYGDLKGDEKEVYFREVVDAMEGKQLTGFLPGMEDVILADADRRMAGATDPKEKYLRKSAARKEWTAVKEENVREIQDTLARDREKVAVAAAGGGSPATKATSLKDTVVAPTPATTVIPPVSVIDKSAKPAPTTVPPAAATPPIPPVVPPAAAATFPEVVTEASFVAPPTEKPPPKVGDMKELMARRREKTASGKNIPAVVAPVAPPLPPAGNPSGVPEEKRYPVVPVAPSPSLQGPPNNERLRKLIREATANDATPPPLLPPESARDLVATGRLIGYRPPSRIETPKPPGIVTSTPGTIATPTPEEIAAYGTPLAGGSGGKPPVRPPVAGATPPEDDPSRGRYPVVPFVPQSIRTRPDTRAVVPYSSRPAFVPEDKPIDAEFEVKPPMLGYRLNAADTERRVRDLDRKSGRPAPAASSDEAFVDRSLGRDQAASIAVAGVSRRLIIPGRKDDSGRLPEATRALGTPLVPTSEDVRLYGRPTGEPSGSRIPTLIDDRSREFLPGGRASMLSAPLRDSTAPNPGSPVPFGGFLPSPEQVAAIKTEERLSRLAAADRKAYSAANESFARERSEKQEAERKRLAKETSAARKEILRRDPSLDPKRDTEEIERRTGVWRDAKPGDVLGYEFHDTSKMSERQRRDYFLTAERVKREREFDARNPETALAQVESRIRSQNPGMSDKDAREAAENVFQYEETMRRKRLKDAANAKATDPEPVAYSRKAAKDGLPIVSSRAEVRAVREAERRMNDPLSLPAGEREAERAKKLSELKKQRADTEKEAAAAEILRRDPSLDPVRDAGEIERRIDRIRLSGGPPVPATVDPFLADTSAMSAKQRGNYFRTAEQVSREREFDARNPGIALAQVESRIRSQNPGMSDKDAREAAENVFQYEETLRLKRLADAARAKATDPEPVAYSRKAAREGLPIASSRAEVRAARDEERKSNDPLARPVDERNAERATKLSEYKATKEKEAREKKRLEDVAAFDAKRKKKAERETEKARRTGERTSLEEEILRRDPGLDPVRDRQEIVRRRELLKTAQSEGPPAPGSLPPALADLSSLPVEQRELYRNKVREAERSGPVDPRELAPYLADTTKMSVEQRRRYFETVERTNKEREFERKSPEVAEAQRKALILSRDPSLNEKGREGDLDLAVWSRKYDEEAARRKSVEDASRAKASDKPPRKVLSAEEKAALKDSPAAKAARERRKDLREATGGPDALAEKQRMLAEARGVDPTAEQRNAIREPKKALAYEEERVAEVRRREEAAGRSLSPAVEKDVRERAKRDYDSQVRSRYVDPSRTPGVRAEEAAYPQGWDPATGQPVWAGGEAPGRPRGPGGNPFERAEKDRERKSRYFEGTVSEIAERRASEEIAKRGGAENLSERTVREIREEQSRRTSDEVLVRRKKERERRLAETIKDRPGISEEEAARIEDERLARLERDPAARESERRRLSERMRRENKGLSEEEANRAADRRIADATADSGTRYVLSGTGGIVGVSKTQGRGDTRDLILKQRAEAEYAKRGGAANLSEETKQTVLETQDKQLDKELREVTARQIRVLRTGVTREESYLLAKEELTKATAENARVLRDSKGRVIGLESNVKALEQAGVRTDGRGRVQGFLADRGSEIGTAYASFRDKSNAFNTRIMDRFGGQQGFNAALIGAGVAGTYAAQGADAMAGKDAETAVLAGREGTYTGWKGASGIATGAVSGLAIGAAVGSVFPVIGPVVGAAAGAVIGGLAGLTTALKEAAQEISRVRIQNSLTIFADRLGILASQMPSRYGAENTSAVLESVRTARREGSEVARRDATGWFTGFDPKAFLQLDSKETRQNFAGQLPTINRFVTTQIEDFAERAVRLGGGGEGGNGGDPRKITDLVLAAGNGLNKELLEVTAKVRKVPFAQLLDELTKQAREALREASGRRQRDAGQVAEGRTSASFERLARAVEGASQGLETLRDRGMLAAAAFSGDWTRGGSGPKVGLDALNDPTGPNRRAFAEAIGVVSAAAGPGSPESRSLRETGEAINRVTSLLGTVLPGVVAGAPLDSEDYTVSVRRQLYTQMGMEASGKDAPEQVKRVVESVLGQLRGLKPEDIAKEVKTDPTKFSEKLTAPTAGTLRENSLRIGRGIEGEAARLSEGFSRLFAMTREIDLNRDAISRSRTGLVRQETQFRQIDGNRRAEGILDVPREVLERPFVERQERLTGFRGAASRDAGFLSVRFDEARRSVFEANERRQEIFRRTGGTSPAFEAASLELERLKDRASRLQQALGNLADASERNATAQEKLSVLQRDRESRLSFGERYLRADDEERVRMQRGMLLTNAANDLGSIKGFAGEDQRLILDTLSSLGNARLRGLKGAPIASDLKDRFVTEATGLGLDPTSKKEENDLRSTILENLRQEQVAREGLIANQQALQQSFFQDLKTANSEFLKGLQAALLGNTVSERRADLGNASEKLGRFAKLDRQRGLLASLGVTSDAGVAELRNAGGDIAKLDDAQRRLFKRNALLGDFRKDKTLDDVLAETYGGKDGRTAAFDPAAMARLASALEERGFDGDEAAGIVSSFRKGKNWGGKAFAGRFTDGNEDDYRKALRAAVEERGGERVNAILTNEVAPARRKLRNRNLDPIELERFLASPDSGGLTALNAATNAFDGKEIRLDTFQSELDTAAKRVKSLEVEVRNLEETLKKVGGTVPGGALPGDAGGGRFGFATGGSVSPSATNGVPGGPRGTDTVPAWLTPGEFVVNAKAAREHASLLDAINSGRGAGAAAFLSSGGRVVSYLAGGGEAGANPVAAPPPAPPVDAVKAAKDKTVAQWEKADPKTRERMRAEFLSGARAPTIWAIKARLEDENFRKLLPPEELGRADAHVEIFGRENKEYLDRTREASSRDLKALFTPEAAPRGTPEERLRRERDSYERAKKAYSSGTMNDADFEQLMRAEGDANAVTANRDLLGLLSPENRGIVRAMREAQKAYLYRRLADEAKTNYGNARLNPEPGKIEKRLNGTEAEILADARGFEIRDRYDRDLKNYGDREKWFGENAGLVRSNKEIRAARKTLTIDERAEQDVLMERNALFEREKVAVMVARREKEAKDAEKARAEEAERVRRRGVEEENKRFQADTPAVARRLKDEARANPFGDSAAILRSRALAARVKDPKKRAILAASLQENLIAEGLRARQFQARYASASPWAAFGLNTPGLDAQAGIAARALEQRTARAGANPNPFADANLKRGRDLLLPGRGPDRLPVDPAVVAGREAAFGAANPGGFAPGEGDEKRRELARVFRFAEGGVVPGTFKGISDTVPAMLTQGEYVFSRKAVSNLGEETLAGLHRMAEGGPVRYLAQGGPVSGVASSAGSPSPGFSSSSDFAASLALFSQGANELAKAVSSLGTASSTLSQALTEFGSKTDPLVRALQAFPSSLSVENNGRVEVVLNGAEVLRSLTSGLQAFVAEKIREAIDQAFKNRLPDA